MGNYVLVEKDSKVMQKCWKWIIIVFLVFILITCFISSYLFQALLTNFNGNCVTGPRIVYKRIPYNSDGLSPKTTEDADFYKQKINETYKEFQMQYVSEGMRNKELDDMNTVPKTHIYQMLNKGASVIQTTTERTNVSAGPSVDELNDINFYKTYQIDETNTEWGAADTCSNFYYFPVVEIIVTIVWIVFISISGRRGDRTAKTFIHKSWRLVVPAVISFGVLAICCSIYAAYLNSALNDFCDEFKAKFSSSRLSCKLLIERFSMNDSTLYVAGTNFNMCKAFAYLRIFLWLFAGFIMLLRCMLGADFELEEVEYSTERNGAAFEPLAENPNSKVKFIDDGIRRYSRERVYKPTTQSTSAE